MPVTAFFAVITILAARAEDAPPSPSASEQFIIRRPLIDGSYTGEAETETSMATAPTGDGPLTTACELSLTQVKISSVGLARLRGLLQWVTLQHLAWLKMYRGTETLAQKSRLLSLSNGYSIMPIKFWFYVTTPQPLKKMFEADFRTHLNEVVWLYRQAERLTKERTNQTYQWAIADRIVLNLRRLAEVTAVADARTPTRRAHVRRVDGPDTLVEFTLPPAYFAETDHPLAKRFGDDGEAATIETLARDFLTTHLRDLFETHRLWVDRIQRHAAGTPVSLKNRDRLLVLTNRMAASINQLIDDLTARATFPLSSDPGPRGEAVPTINLASLATPADAPPRRRQSDLMRIATLLTSVQNAMPRQSRLDDLARWARTHAVTPETLSDLDAQLERASRRTWEDDRAGEVGLAQLAELAAYVEDAHFALAAADAETPDASADLVLATRVRTTLTRARAAAELDARVRAEDAKVVANLSLIRSELRHPRSGQPPDLRPLDDALNILRNRGVISTVSLE